MTEALVAWLPLVAILGGFLLFMRYANGSYRKHVDKVEAINDENIRINREMIAELREIKQILKDQK